MPVGHDLVSPEVFKALLSGGTIGGVLTFVGARLKSRAEARTAKATTDQALMKLAQDAAAEMVTALRIEIAALREDAVEDRKRAVEDRQRIAELERDLAAEKKARATERHELADRATKAEARAMLAERASEAAAGERRQLQQLVDSLTRLLRDHGIPLPAPVRATEPVLLGDPTA